MEVKKEKGNYNSLSNVEYLNHDVFTICGFVAVNLSENQLAVCQPHSLKGEKWGLSCYGLKLGCVERGLKESERWWV